MYHVSLFLLTTYKHGMSCTARSKTFENEVNYRK